MPSRKARDFFTSGIKCVSDNKTCLYPQLGTAVSGWRVTGSAPDHQWSLLGIQDPQLPEAFYPVDNSSVVIRNNDVIATRCTMDNWKTEAVR